MITNILHNPIKYPSVCQILKSKSVLSTGGPQVHHKDLTSVEGNLCGMTRPPCIGPARMCVYIGPRRRLDYQECISYCVHLAPSYHLLVPSLRLHLSVIDDGSYFRKARDPKLLRLASSPSTLPCLPANKRTPFFPALQIHSHSSSSRFSNFSGFLFSVP
ncbi:unnamed protein product [Musa textilis]